MTAPTTPDERAAMRETVATLDAAWEADDPTRPLVTEHATLALLAHVASAVPRLLDALDTAEAERDEARAEAAVARQHQREASLAIRYVEGLRKERDDALAESDQTILRQRDRLRAREEQVRRLRAEVTRLHALVADLRAATSPAWDEDAAALAVFERSHEPSFEDSEEGMREAKRFVLSLLPGRSEAEVKAEALRDAAEAARRCWTGYTYLPDPGDPEVAHSFDRWIEVRADRIEKGDTR